MGRMVEFQANGRKGSGYLAGPTSGKRPGVIVIQEWWGLVPHIQNVADRFAEAGFVALAPDLYHGQSTKSPDEAARLMMAMRIDEAEQDIRGAINYLVGQPGVLPGKVGTVGFCMGGALSLYAATKNDKVGACVVYYGGHPKVQPDLPNLQAPMLGFYGERDGSVTPQSARELEQKLKGLGKQAEVHVYPGADHAFFNDERQEVYNPAAAEDSWKRMLEFFNQQL